MAAAVSAESEVKEEEAWSDKKKYTKQLARYFMTFFSS